MFKQAQLTSQYAKKYGYWHEREHTLTLRSKFFGIETVVDLLNIVLYVKQKRHWNDQDIENKLSCTHVMILNYTKYEQCSSS